MPPAAASARLLRSPVRAKTQIRLGFVPLSDSAPLTVARELGLFAKHGLDVVLTRELGWASRECRLALRPALLGPFDCGNGNRIAASDLLRFHGPTLNAPTGEKAVWLLAQMRHAKLLTTERAPEGAFRPELLEEALNMPSPAKPAAPGRKKVPALSGI